MKHGKAKTLVTAASIGVVAALALTGCGGAGGSTSGSGGGDVVNVLMVNNPQMVDLQKLTADNFTKKTGIKVNYTVLPENDVRAKISQEFSSQAGQYDVATISNYEVPSYAKNGWLSPLDDTVAKSKDFDQSDILPAMTQALTAEDGKLYAEPFYGESSFLMFRKDVFEKAGVTMPEKPTWQEVADLAAKVDGVEPGMKGICLRGQPGWGQIFAPLTTVVNTFGGTWFEKNWKPGVDSAKFEEAVNFYVDLINAHGENGAPQAGFTECLNNLQQGKVAMWYDATSAAGSLEASDSPVAGKIGYVAAPVKETKSSGWLYTWAFAIEKAGKHQDAAAKFIAWASSKKYEETVGKDLGWSRVPAGKRASTYENTEYQKSASAFYQQTVDAIKSVDPANPGVQARPAPGIQFVAIPEFADMATQVSQDVSSAIAGKESVADALKKGQVLAQKVSDKYTK
ncbi:sugar ABC transporter substrate-binding protein [Glaciihabitans sp. UYNi722]|uniref:ABC transporter substrate-binding protein n=1 Tax=Glaciihabitans sp. UYNi722 TaxID=3156344 RepID=UPI0033965149